MSSTDGPSAEVAEDPATPVTTRRNGSPAHRRPSPVLRAVGSAALARIIALPVSAILGIVVTRLLIDEYGQGSYAQYMLVVSIGALLPFADLGLAVSILNATAAARDPRSDERLRLTLVSCIRLLTVSATLVVSLAVVIFALGAWDDILGDALSPGAGPVAASLCLAVLGMTLTVSFGQRILAGLGKYSWVVALNGLQTPIVLGVLIVMIRTGVGTGVYLAVVAYIATMFLGLVALAIADRMVRPTLRLALQGAVRVRSVRGARVFGTAWPMLIQMVAVALAMQSDRIVLSHVSTIEALAEYSLAAQMFSPVLAVVATASMALWPVFARARDQGVRSEVSPMRMAVLFGVVALGCAVALSLVSGFLAELASGGAITLSLQLVLAYSVLVTVQAVKYPLGTYMTDAKGLRYQAFAISLMLPVNFGLSWVLAGRFGAVGPVIGSIVGVALFEVLANWVYIHRQHSRTGDIRPVRGAD